MTNVVISSSIVTIMAEYLGSVTEKDIQIAVCAALYNEKGRMQHKFFVNQNVYLERIDPLSTKNTAIINELFESFSAKIPVSLTRKAYHVVVQDFTVFTIGGFRYYGLTSMEMEKFSTIEGLNPDTPIRCFHGMLTPEGNISLAWCSKPLKEIQEHFIIDNLQRSNNKYGLLGDNLTVIIENKPRTEALTELEEGKQELSNSKAIVPVS